jgi:hypothetical protein
MNDRPGFVPANTPPPIPGYESLWPGVNMGTALSGLRAQKVQLTPSRMRGSPKPAIYVTSSGSSISYSSALC